MEAILLVEREDDPVVTIGAGLPTRRVDILRHRFATLALRDAFLTWIDEGQAEHKAKALALIGLLEGSDELARHMDGIAATYLLAGTRSPPAGLH